MRKPTTSRTTVILHELPAPTPAPAPVTSALVERDQVVFVTNAVRRRGGLRARAEHPEHAGQHRPVLAVVLR